MSRLTRWTNGPAAFTKRGVENVRAPPRVAAVTPRTRPPATSTRSTRPRLFGRPNEGRDTLGVGGDEEIAAATHPERVTALARELLEEVDGPVHQRDHLVAGARPPVAVALGRLVAGEGERRAFVHQDDVGHAAPHREVVRGGDAGDPRPTDHDVCRRRAHHRKGYAPRVPFDKRVGPQAPARSSSGNRPVVSSVNVLTSRPVEIPPRIGGLAQLFLAYDAVA